MVFDANDYEDFRMQYNKYDLDFMIKNLKEFIVSDYINKFYRKNANLILEVIDKLQDQLNIIIKLEEKEDHKYIYYSNTFRKFEVMISFTYDEIITLLYYLNCIEFKESHDYRRRDELVRELKEYIGEHKGWLDFRKITTQS